MAQAPLLGAETQRHWSERIPREAAEALRRRHSGVDVTVEQAAGRPMTVLAERAQDAELLVLGSRGLSGIGGFLVGSVGMAVIAHTTTPVVLVRAGEQPGDEHAKDDEHANDRDGASSDRDGASFAEPNRPVVLALDTDHPDDTAIAFAFEAAARRGAVLKAVHGWNLPPYFAYGLAADPELDAELGRQDAAALSRTLRPWRMKYPDVEVVEESRVGSPADQVVDASREASLVVVGRRVRRSPIGAHIGPVTHAVLHHCVAPVAVIAHE
jgi:nucleotide-binding universal stress UspA family protein